MEDSLSLTYYSIHPPLECISFAILSCKSVLKIHNFFLKKKDKLHIERFMGLVLVQKGKLVKVVPIPGVLACKSGTNVPLFWKQKNKKKTFQCLFSVPWDSFLKPFSSVWLHLWFHIFLFCFEIFTVQAKNLVKFLSQKPKIGQKSVLFKIKTPNLAVICSLGPYFTKVKVEKPSDSWSLFIFCSIVFKTFKISMDITTPTYQN